MKQTKNRRRLKSFLIEWFQILLLASPFVILLIAYHNWCGWLWIALMWIYFLAILGFGIWAAAQPWDELDAVAREEEFDDRIVEEKL